MSLNAENTELAYRQTREPYSPLQITRRVTRGSNRRERYHWIPLDVA